MRFLLSAVVLFGMTAVAVAAPLRSKLGRWERTTTVEKPDGPDSRKSGFCIVPGKDVAEKPNYDPETTPGCKASAGKDGGVAIDCRPSAPVQVWRHHDADGLLDAFSMEVDQSTMPPYRGGKATIQQRWLGPDCDSKLPEGGL